MLRTSIRALALACGGFIVAGCTEPGADPLAPPGAPAAAATVQVLEFADPIAFQFDVACVGGTVDIAGTVSGWDRIVERSDGSIHITTRMNVSDVTITLGDQVWTAGPNASEIFIVNFPADDGPLQIEHLGAVIFRGADDRPALQLVHQIHIVNLPTGEPRLNRQSFSIRCIAPNR